MSQNNAIRIDYEVLRSLGFASIGASYAAIGTPLLNPARIIVFKNTTDENVLLSKNGIDDHDVLAANSAFVVDYTANASSQAGVAVLPSGTQWYVKQQGVPPTLGSVWITVIYASNV